MAAFLKALNQRHYRILDLAVLGRTNAEIARELQMSEGQVSIILHSPQFQHEFAIRRESIVEHADEQLVDGEDEVTKALREGAVDAAKKLVESVNAADRSLAVRASGDILDRAGYPKVQKREGGGGQQTVIISSSDISRLTESLEMSSGSRVRASTG